MRRTSTPVSFSISAIGDERAKGVAVIRVAVQGLSVEHELTALGQGDWGR